jgi:mycothiol synthase
LANPTPDWLPDFIARVRAVDGQPPFSDQALVDLRTGARELVAIDESAAALVSPTEAEFAVDPTARGIGLGTALLEGLLAGSPGGLLIWAHGDHPAARALAASHGLTAVRELLHLQLPEIPARTASSSIESSTPTVSSAEAASPTEAASPVAAPSQVDVAGERSAQPTPSGVRIAAFRPGTDDAAWVALNARAFVSHPEQGRVTLDDLNELVREGWFAADDFLVAWDGDTMVGYCWLKVEDDTGEFYVVGIDPDQQGRGLGRLLTEAGLERLRSRDIHRAHLYVEGDNAAAVGLYRSLGFIDDSIDIQYRAG